MAMLRSAIASRVLDMPGGASPRESGLGVAHVLRLRDLARYAWPWIQLMQRTLAVCAGGHGVEVGHRHAVSPRRLASPEPGLMSAFQNPCTTLGTTLAPLHVDPPSATWDRDTHSLAIFQRRVRRRVLRYPGVVGSASARARGATARGLVQPCTTDRPRQGDAAADRALGRSVYPDAYRALPAGGFARQRPGPIVSGLGCMTGKPSLKATLQCIRFKPAAAVMRADRAAESRVGRAVG